VCGGIERMRTIGEKAAHWSAFAQAHSVGFEVTYSGTAGVAVHEFQSGCGTLRSGERYFAAHARGRACTSIRCTTGSSRRRILNAISIRL